LSRYFGGDVDLSTLRAVTLEWDEPAGVLAKVPVDESKIKPEEPYSTCYFCQLVSPTHAGIQYQMLKWHHRKYKNGGVGILNHLAVLQGTNYSCEFEVYCDGCLLKSGPRFPRIFISPLIDDALRLFDPYNRPVLHVRRPGSDDVEEYKFLDDDPFLTEFSEFVDVIEHGKPSGEFAEHI
jgi:hypothetical protein